MDDFNYKVFVTTDTMMSFGCGKSGHLISGCPENLTHHSEENDRVEDNIEQNEDGEGTSTSNTLNKKKKSCVSRQKC